MKCRIELPDSLIPVFSKPRGELRYRGAYGGRGSGKSFNFAKMSAIWGAAENLRILCVREFQNSITESFFAEVKNAIESEEYLKAVYDVGVNYIKCKTTGTEYLFRGLRNNIQSIKSLAQIDLCIVEEAENISEAAWVALEPTIRAPKSEIHVIWNPETKGSPTDKRFIQNTPPRSAIVKMNYSENFWFPKELEEQRQHALKTLDHATYRHIWEGDYLELTDAQVFKDKYEIRDFEVDYFYGEPIHGMDFGFSQDPSTMVQLYIKDNELYIRHAAGKVGLELDDTAQYFKDRIPKIESYTIRADSARPESISYLSRKGLPFITAVTKGKGSVEDGISFMKSFKKIIIHSSLLDVAKEFKMYKYKVDARTGDILPDIIDAHNHYIDACRYALQPMMSKGNTDYSGLA